MLPIAIGLFVILGIGLITSHKGVGLSSTDDKLAILGRQIQEIARSSPKQFMVVSVVEATIVSASLLSSFDTLSEAIKFLNTRDPNRTDSWIIFDRAKIRQG